MRAWHSLVLPLLLWAGTSVAAQAPTAIASFRDCPICPAMVWMPPGKFMMGDSPAVEERAGTPTITRGRSQPVHEVVIAKRFAMGKYPVTRGEFRAFVQETGYQTANSCYVIIKADGHANYEEAPGYSWRDPGYPQTDDHPVVCVDWNDASAYAQWLSRKTKHAYGLASEAQFEYAERAGTTTAYFWGEARDEQACKYSNMPDLSEARDLGAVPKDAAYRFPCDDGYGYSSPVGHYLPNAFGLYDMMGNVWEWIDDCYSPGYKGAPTDGSSWRAGDCDLHGNRGGSYGNTPNTSSAGFRAYKEAGYRGNSFGFRVARAQ